MKPINIKKALLSFVLVILSALTANAQQSLWVGESYTFDVSSSVMGLTANMSWSTSGGYLSLSGSGFYRTITVTQYFSGTATVTCEWDYKLTGNGSYTHTKRQVTISCRDNQVSISPSSMTLSPEESGSVSYRHQYDNQYTSYANAYFQSSDSRIATVNERTGEVSAVSPGTTYINVYSKISSVSPYCIVTVKQVNPTDVSLPSSLSLTAGEQKKLIPTLFPSNAQTSFTWTSSDTNIATVSSDGNITAKKHGSAIISVKTSNGLIATCNLTVYKPKLKIDMSLEDGLYPSGQLLHLNTNCADAIIYYTLDGTEPTTKSIPYSGYIILNNSVSLRAIALHEDYITSDIINGQFDVTSLKFIDCLPNAQSCISSIMYPTILFNEPICNNIDKSKIHCLFKGRDTEFNAYVSIDKLVIVPIAEDYFEGGEVNITLKEYCVVSNSQQPNYAMTLNGYVNSSDALYVSHPIKLYAGSYASTYINNTGEFNSFGGWPTENGWTFYTEYSFENVSSSCESESIVPFVDNNYNLWVAGMDGWFFSFHNQPIIYQTGVRECAYAKESTLFYVTLDDELYGVGSDRFKQLLGKGDKKTSTSYETVYYAETPVKLMDNVLHVYSDDRNCAVIKTDNSLWFWGCVYHTGGNYERISTPYKVSDNVIQASIGNETPVTYVCEDNSAWYLESSAYKKIKIADNVKYIFGGEERGYYITNDGKLYGWGRNDHGQLGIGKETSYPYLKPTEAVFIMDDIIDVSCNWDYTLALTSNFEIYGWGCNAGYRFDRNKSTSYNQTEPIIVYFPNKNPVIQNITLPQEFTAYVNMETAIPIEVEPLNGICKFYEWSTSDSSIANVTQKGIVFPNKEGECVLTLTVIGQDDSIIRNEVKLVVKPELENSIMSIKYTDNDNVIIYNLQGQPVYSGLVENIPSLPHGVYLFVNSKGTSKVLL